MCVFFLNLRMYFYLSPGAISSRGLCDGISPPPGLGQTRFSRVRQTQCNLPLPEHTQMNKIRLLKEKKSYQLAGPKGVLLFPSFY